MNGMGTVPRASQFLNIKSLNLSSPACQNAEMGHPSLRRLVLVGNSLVAKAGLSAMPGSGSMVQETKLHSSSSPSPWYTQKPSG